MLKVSPVCVNCGHGARLGKVRGGMFYLTVWMVYLVDVVIVLICRLLELLVVRLVQILVSCTLILLSRCWVS